jgi:hypothetical protein
MDFISPGDSSAGLVCASASGKQMAVSTVSHILRPGSSILHSIGPVTSLMPVRSKLPMPLGKNESEKDRA